MTDARDLVPAVGGKRMVPKPDPIASDYLLLGLRFDQHLPGLVDGYYGPAELKAQADTEQLRGAPRLRDDVASLADRVDRDVEATDRRDWLHAQLRALEAHALALAGEPLPYLDHVERSLGIPPRRHPDEEFDAAVAEIDALLPGAGSVAERLDAFDRRSEIPIDRIVPVAEWLVDRFREGARRDFGVPDGEATSVTTVTDRAWIAHDWYLGGRRSRIELNVDLPVTAHDLIITLGHEAYPGHHLEAAWREADLVERQRRLEVSMILTARGADQRGTRAVRDAFRVTARATGGSASRDLRTRQPADRGRPSRRSRGRRSGRQARRPPRSARRRNG